MTGLDFRPRAVAVGAVYGLLLLAAAACAGSQASSATTPSSPASVRAELEAAEGAGAAALPRAANGTFTALRVCPLYQSKREKTNPGSLSTSVDARYAIRESQKGKDGAWFRVQTDAAASPLRWVSAECGVSDANEHPEDDVCRLPGHQDANVLALSWQPAFCASHQEKTECEKATPERYDATHFTLHGLWPNQSACGRDYGYCGGVHTQPRDFCSYPEVTLTPETRKRLAQVMPSVAYGTCLERHEWWKHGTCWAGDPDAYFSEALRIAQLINESPVVTEVLRAAIGKSIEASALQGAIDAAFGSNASKKFELDCTDAHELVEVRVSLPANIQPDEPMSTLLQRSQNAPSGCTGRIKILTYGN